MVPVEISPFVSHRAKRYWRLRQVEERFGRPAEEILASLYMVDRMSIAQVAERLGVSQRQVHRWLVAMGIPRRHQHWDYGPGEAR